MADRIKSLVDIGIGISDDCEPKRMQISIPLGIVLRTGTLIVLRAVQFNNKLGFGNVEIDDIVPDYFLTVEDRKSVV